MTKPHPVSLLAFTRRDYLPGALLVSAAVHAAVIAVRWPGAQEAVPPTRPGLEITLVNTQTERAPVQPQVLAQASLDGGGENDQGIAASPLPRTTEAIDEVDYLQALRKQQQELEARQERLLAQLVSTYETAERPTESDPADDTGPPGDDALEQQERLLSAQISALKEQINRYNAQPRREFIGPSAQGVDYAAYLESWRAKIELIGTEHYPDQARGKIYGSLQVTVYIRKDGTVERVEFDRPSSEPVLNLAASRIIQLASPFAPLPDSIAQRTDVLAITRTWHFVREQLETTP
jgi:protein TonB